MKYDKRFLLIFCIAMMWFPFQSSSQEDNKISDKVTEPTKVFTAEDFKNYPTYDGADLGLAYSPKKSTFKIWSPPAKEVRLFMYDNGIGGDTILIKNMKKEKRGIWSAKVTGDQEGKFYAFQVLVDTTWLAESPDPYARATGVNGKRAMIVDLKKTNPAGWENDRRPPLKSFADIVLYELHLRDISHHPSSGIANKCKYLGLTETGTKTPDGMSTGLDHIVELGATHVHLLPVFDFMSIDETKLEDNVYNWGYDPQNYNAPEGSYSTDPYDGRVRIREFKEMVKALHDNGLRVVMDVVYNHTGANDESVFNQMVPMYYYRLNQAGGYSDASACGNEVASERFMVRKFIVESMVYWAKEYHIDGFRVDLMGIHDIETMNQVAKELRKIDPTIFIYGEGWTAEPSPLDEKLRAVKANVSKLDGIAAFCDELRDGVKGHVFSRNAAGFINGETDLEESVKFGIVGAVEHPGVNYALVNYSKAPWANSPLQCINYVSCHDNHTLWDRLKNTCRSCSEEELLSMDKLAQTIVLTSQGIPFLHAGEEFVRSKLGLENSYSSPDIVNQINWDNKAKYHSLFEYYKNLIQLRKQHPAFRMGNQEMINRHLEFLDFPFDNMLGYLIKDNANGDSWKRILLIFNGNKVGKSVTIPEGNWKIICQNGRIELDGMGMTTDTRASLHPFSAIILAEEN